MGAEIWVLVEGELSSRLGKEAAGRKMNNWKGTEARVNLGCGEDKRRTTWLELSKGTQDRGVEELDEAVPWGLSWTVGLVELDSLEAGC